MSTGLIEGPFFAAVRVMELDCRYSSISEIEGSGADVEPDGASVASVSGASSSVFLRFFFSFLDVPSSGASSRFLRFFLRSNSSEAGAPASMSLK